MRKLAEAWTWLCAAIESAHRPRARRDCAGGVRPCPRIWCRENLLAEHGARGSLKVCGIRVVVNGPSRTRATDEAVAEAIVSWQGPSCALDVAEEGDHPLTEIGRIGRVTREAARLRERNGLLELRMEHPELREIYDAGIPVPQTPGAWMAPRHRRAKTPRRAGRRAGDAE